MIVLDTSGLLAFYDRSDPYYEAVSAVMDRPQRRIMSPFVLAEIDYLLTQNAGQAIAFIMLEEVTRHAYELAQFSSSDFDDARRIMLRYADLGIGLADASNVVLAERYGCYDILTLDQRHFRAITSPSGKTFRLLPLDDSHST